MSRPIRRSTLFVAVLVAAALLGRPPAGHAAEPMTQVAVFPVENLSGSTVPSEDVRAFLIGRLASDGIRVLHDAALDQFMTRHRVRYAAGIDAQTAESLRSETGVEGVVIASFELSSATVPPKVALIVRLVSIRATPTVVWADDVGMTGDDAPGFFDLGIVNDYAQLFTRALDRLGDSLAGHLKTGAVATGGKRASRFKPKTAFRAIALEPGRPSRVAVVPFVNLSDRRNAGEILALLFMRHLSVFPEFQVADTGVVRRQLLDARIIMEGGLSLSDAENVAALADSDFVLGGRVLRYEDHEGPGGATRVEFSAVLIERRSRRVVWSSDSYNTGYEHIGFFERGITRTAHAMATQMVAIAAGMIAGHGR